MATCTHLHPYDSNCTIVLYLRFENENCTIVYGTIIVFACTHTSLDSDRQDSLFPEPLLWLWETLTTRVAT